MAFNIILRPSGQQFQAEHNESVLGAAIRQGIGLPYGCKNGTCGSCKGAVLSGVIEQAMHSAPALSNDEKLQGMVLFCCAIPKSDLELKVREVAGITDTPARKLPCRIQALERVADDVMIMRLQLPAQQKLQYFAGQYIEFLLKDGKRRSYSIATPPHHDGPIELHIRHMPGGVFTDHVFSSIKERDMLFFEGPLGTFFLREGTRPIILLASGTGFAPIKAIVEHMISMRIERSVSLYWGARRSKDMYLAELAQQWAHRLPHFTFVPVLSEPAPEDHWQGRTGFVHQVVAADLPDLSAYEVYACGAPAMVKAALCDFTTHHGLAPENFYADAFTSEVDLANFEDAF